MKKAKIVSGFPGVGKSTLFTNPNGLIVLDSDSSSYSWSDQEKKIRNPDFPANYISHIEENMDSADIILVSTHAPVRDGLVRKGIDFILVYPGLDMRDEYIERYVSRGSAAEFVNLLHTNYNGWVEELMAQEGCRHVVLRPGQHLSDVVHEIMA